MRNYIILLLFIAQNVNAQLPGIAWKKVYGDKGTEAALDVIANYDGNIAVLGLADNKTSQKDDAVFLLIDKNGQVLQQKQFGLTKNDRLNAMAQTFDGGYMLAGQTTSTINGKTQPWLVKLSEIGDTLWQKIIEQEGEAAFNDIIQTGNGELVMTGYIEKPDGNRDIWVYCVYEDGAMRWQRTYGDDHYDEGRKLVETKEGNFGVGGVTSSGKGGRNLWLFLLDKEGNPLQYRIFGSKKWEELTDLIATSDGGFALAGTATTNIENKGKGLKDFWLIKTSGNGEMQWQNTFGGQSNEGANGVVETSDGGFVIAGYTFSHIMGANTPAGYVVKTNSKGKFIWEDNKTFGGRASDELTAITTLQDGSIVMVGTTSSKEEGAKDKDIWVIQLHPEAHINHRNATKLVINSVDFKDNGDLVLEEGEKSYFKIMVTNTGDNDAFDVELSLKEKTGLEYLKYRDFQKIGVIKAGQNKEIFVPIIGLGGLKFGDLTMEFSCSDISRSTSPIVEKSVPVKPLNLPSNYLDVIWLDPNPVEFINFEKTVKSKDFTIRVKARSDKDLLRKYFTIFVNGKSWQIGAKAGEANLNSRGKAREIHQYEYTNRIVLQMGENIVEVEVDNGTKKIRSKPFKLILSNKPNLHILAIGIEHDDLNYTKKDAGDFAKCFVGLKEGNVFDKTFVTTLISGERNQAGVIQTNGDNLRKAFTDMRDNYNYTIYEQDLLVVFISSHGKTIRNDFKIVPTDFQIAGETALVDYRKDVVDPLDALPCQKILFIDACHSGSADAKVGITTEETAANANSLITQGNDNKSTNMMASCGAAESSWEDKSWGNGAFTSALIGAFKNEVFHDEKGEFQPTTDDKVLTIGELYTYLGRRVPQMIKNAGKDSTQKPHMEDKQLQRVANKPIFEIN
jgi:Caspase domain